MCHLPCLGLRVSACAILLLTCLLGSLMPSPARAAAQAVGIALDTSSHAWLLWNNNDGTYALWNTDPSGNLTASYTYGPFTDSPVSSAVWQATALSAGPNNSLHILWTNPDGREVLWNLDNQGHYSYASINGPYPDGAGGPLYTPVSLATGADGVSHILWTTSAGKVILWNVNTDYSVTAFGVYGPFPASSPAGAIWTAVSVSASLNGSMRVLWANPNDGTILWSVNGAGGYSIIGTYAPFSDDGTANTLARAKALATGPDGVSHLLWTAPSGKVTVRNVDTSGNAASLCAYGPISGWSGQAIAAGPDSIPHLLWDKTDGSAAHWTLPPAPFANTIYPSAIGLTLSATSVQGGMSVAGTVALNAPAGPGGVAVALSSSNRFAASMPATVTVPAGQTTVGFTVTTPQTATAASAAIYASCNISSPTVTLKVTPTSPDFSLSVNPGSVSIAQGASKSRAVMVNPLYGFGGNVSLVDSTLPSGVTAIFSPNPTAGTSTLTLTATSTAALGSTSVTITGTSGSLVHNATLMLNIVPPPPLPPTNVSVSQSGTSIGVSWTGSSGAATYNVYRSTTSGGPYNFLGSTANLSYSDNSAIVGTFYYYVITTVNSSGAESSYSGGGNTVVLTGSVSPDIPAPGWAEEALASDEASGGGSGPAASNSVCLASGVEESHPGPDLVAFNPIGPSASYERQYRSALANKHYGSPGLALGWVDNYDMTVQAGTGGTYVLQYPSGATETWSPGTGSSFTPPVGAPYLVSSVSGGFTMTLPDHSRYSFALNPNHSGSTVYWLAQITNAVGHSIVIARDTLDRLLSIKNDAAPATTLLSFSYSGPQTFSGAYLGSLTDAYGRSILYAFTNSGNAIELFRVSKLNATDTFSYPLWEYGYYANVLLSSIKAPDPSNPGTNSQSACVVSYDGNVVSSVQDGNQNVHSYRYGGGMTVVQANNADGSLAQQWLQDYDPTKSNVDTGDKDANNQQSLVTYSGTPSIYLPDSVTNRNLQKTTIGYDTTMPYGNVKTVIGPRNTATSLGYDPAFPLGQVQSVQTGNQAATTCDYYPNGFLSHVYTPLPELVPGTNTTTYVYDNATDNLGNIKIVTAPGANGMVTVSYEYHTGYNGYTQSPALGEPVAVTVIGPDALGGITSTTTYSQYDNRGNRTAVIDALGNETDFQYNIT